MSRSRRSADNTRGHRFAAVEELDMNPSWRHANGCKRLLHIRQKASRPAEVYVRLPRDGDLVEDRPRQVTDAIEILTHLVAQTRSAVANVAAGARKGRHEAADFSRERMMKTISCRVAMSKSRIATQPWITRTS